MSAYGILISLGIFIVASSVEKKAKKHGVESSLIWDLLIVGVLGGLLGARAYHVVSAWEYYKNYPEQIFQLWNGGLALYGALAGGFVSLWLYAKQKKFKLLPYIDLIATALPLAQSLGRIGNFLNQELYGLPTQLPWKIYITPENRVKGFENTEYYHPLFAYEIILNLILFSVLNKKLQQKPQHIGTGYFIWLYLAGYMAIRFMLEFLRVHSWSIYSVNIAQIIAVTIFILAVRNLIKFRVK